MTANNNHTSNNGNLSFPEAPASWNTRYVDPNGFECQITLRGDTGAELLEKANNAITFLLKNGCTPYVYYRRGSKQVETKSNDAKEDVIEGNDKDNPAWCPIHECEMKRWDKNGRVWYSHKVDGEWCSGK